MSETAKTLLVVVVMVCALQCLEWLFGSGIALTVAVAAFSFCIGALWGAVSEIEKAGKRP